MKRFLLKLKLLRVKGSPTEFMAYLNTMSPDLKFTVKFYTKCIHFSDTLIKIEEGKLLTSFYHDETDCNTFVLASSFTCQDFEI